MEGICGHYKTCRHCTKSTNDRRACNHYKRCRLCPGPRRTSSASAPGDVRGSDESRSDGFMIAMDYITIFRQLIGGIAKLRKAKAGWNKLEEKRKSQKIAEKKKEEEKRRRYAEQHDVTRDMRELGGRASHPETMDRRRREESRRSHRREEHKVEHPGHFNLRSGSRRNRQSSRGEAHLEERSRMRRNDEIYANLEEYTRRRHSQRNGREHFDPPHRQQTSTSNVRDRPSREYHRGPQQGHHRQYDYELRRTRSHRHSEDR